MADIRLTLKETITNKADGSQVFSATVTDQDGRAIEGFAGASIQLSPAGRILVLQLSLFAHAITQADEQTGSSEVPPLAQ